MERDCAAACRLLDVHLCTIYGDMLYVGIRIRIVRCRDCIGVEQGGLSAEVAHIEAICILRCTEIDDAASILRRASQILHMTCACDIPTCAVFEEGEV